MYRRLHCDFLYIHVVKGVSPLRSTGIVKTHEASWRNGGFVKSMMVIGCGKGLLVGVMILFVLLLVGAASAQIGDHEELRESLDVWMEEQIHVYQIPNAVVAIVADGEIAALRGYGFADLESQTPIDSGRSVFRIGSTAKLVTWTAVMQLVEQGILDLTADVNEYLDFQIPGVIALDGRPAAPITLEHLMTHTPGFEDYMSDIFSLDPEMNKPLAQRMRDGLPARVFPPGEVIAYSNYGASLAGYIVERVSGIPFAQYVEENIFEPLGMESSTFRQPLPGDLAASLAKPYRFVDGQFREAQFEYMSEPGGSMSSTAPDMARFMLGHLQGGELDGHRILQAGTVDTMHSQLFTHHPKLPGMAHGFIEGRFNDRRVLLHPGGTMLYDTALYLLPDEQVGVFLTHSGGSAMANVQVFAQFMDTYFAEEDMATVPQPPAGADARARALAGEYHQNRRSFTTDDKMLSLMFGTISVSVDDGHLVMQHMGRTHRFVEIEPGLFRNASPERVLDLSGDLRTIAFGTDPLGRSMLMMAGPVSYSRAPWYERSVPNLVALGGSILFILVSLLVWVGSSLIRRLRRHQHEQTLRGARLARWIGILFALLTLVVVLEFLMVGEPDPVYLLPTPAYTEVPPWSAVISQVVPLAMTAVGILALLTMLLSWKGRYWGLAARVHYTMFTVAGVLLLGIFYHWNILAL